MMDPLFGSGSRELQSSHWRPLADIYRTPHGWLIKLELAGVRPEDIQVLVQGRILRVRGRRGDWIYTEASQCYSLEITYSSFERAFEIPCEGMEDCQIDTEYRDGMLLIRIASEEPAE